MQDIESSDISCHNFPQNEAESPHLRVFKYLSGSPSRDCFSCIATQCDWPPKSITPFSPPIRTTIKAHAHFPALCTSYTYLRCDWCIQLAVSIVILDWKLVCVVKYHNIQTSWLSDHWIPCVTGVLFCCL